MARLTAFLRTRSGTVVSAVLHALLIGWGLLSFSARSLEAMPPPSDFVPVDVVTQDQQITKGSETGKKENTKPKVEKLAEPTPIDQVGKITEKKEVLAAKETQAEAKPPEPKPEPKPVEKKPEPQVDQINELMKKDQAKKPVDKKEAKPEPKKDEKPKKERTFDSSKIAELIDKRDPSRRAATGETKNNDDALGKKSATGAKLSMNWAGALVDRIRQCWNVPPGIRDADKIKVLISIQLRPDGTVSRAPKVVGVSGGDATSGPVMGESAQRAILQCQPYDFLPKAEYAGGWDDMEIGFSLRDR